MPGLDPDPEDLPDGFARDIVGVERFAALVLGAALPYVAAVKPNLAFYEALGSAGIAALERLAPMIPADVPVMMDAKRADIGTTAARQAVALFDALAADAVTVNPYLGEAAIEPLLERLDRFAYVLCRTSNAGAAELQDLRRRRGRETAPAGAPARARRPTGRDWARAERSASSSARPGRRRWPGPRDRARPRVPGARAGRPGRRPRRSPGDGPASAGPGRRDPVAASS